MLSDATSGTILYEDVVYDWQGQHQALYDRVELFKEKNGMDESVKYTDEEFRKVFLALAYSRRYGTEFRSLWSQTSIISTPIFRRHTPAIIRPQNPAGFRGFFLA